MRENDLSQFQNKLMSVIPYTYTLHVQKMKWLLLNMTFS